MRSGQSKNIPIKPKKNISKAFLPLNISGRIFCMAYQNVKASDILYPIKTKTQRTTMQNIFRAAGSNAIFRVDKDDWDMKQFPLPDKNRRGTKQITIKSSAATINNIIKAYKNKPNTDTYKESEYITIVFRIGQAYNRPQKVKFEKTGKLVDSQGRSISDATMTAMQELGSAWVFHRAFKRAGGFNNWQAIKNDEETFDVLRDIWKKLGDVEGPDDDWVENFYAQSKAVLANIRNGKFDEFTRGSSHSSVTAAGKRYTLPGMKTSDTFMEYVTDFVKDNYGISQKDNWDPADIWMIRHEEKYRKAIDDTCKYDGPKGSPSMTAQLLQLNAILRSAYKRKDIVGISLKKVSGKTAKFQAVNVSGKFLQQRQVGNKFTLEYKADRAQCPLGVKSTRDGGATIETQDSRFLVVDGATVYNFQIKANTSTKKSGLKYEATQEGAAAARLGKATVEKVLSLMAFYGLSFNKEPDSYPYSPAEFLAKRDTYARMITDLQRKGVTFGRGEDVDKMLDTLLFLFNEEPWVANSKLQQITWLHKVMMLPSQKLNRFATDLVFLSKKEGAEYGPFGKVY